MFYKSAHVVNLIIVPEKLRVNVRRLQLTTDYAEMYKGIQVHI